MSSATVITNRTAGAPVLNGVEGSLYNLISYIATQFGWDVLYRAGNKIVIRPQSFMGGQPLCYRFDDRTARGGYAPRFAGVSVYETMVNIDTGSGRVLAPGVKGVSKSTEASTTPYPYEVIGDAYGFYLRTVALQDVYIDYRPANTHYFGFLSRLGNLHPVCVACASPLDAMGYCSDFSMCHPEYSSGGSVRLHKSYDGLTIGVDGGNIAATEPNMAISNEIYGGTAHLRSPWNGNLYLVDTRVSWGGEYSGPAGKYPGLYGHLNRIFQGKATDPLKIDYLAWGEGTAEPTYTQGDSMLRMMPCRSQGSYSDQHSTLFVDVGNGFRV